MAGVSSRTRSRNATHHCSLDGSSSSSSKRRKRASTESVVVVIADDDGDNSNGEEGSVKKEEKVGTSDVTIVDKGENFGEEDECGLGDQNPITIESDDFDDSDDSSSTDETSDEGYEAGDLKNESSKSEDSSSSDDDAKKNFLKYRKVVEEMLIKAKIEISGNCNKSLKHADHARASVSSQKKKKKKGSFEMKACSSKISEESAEKKQKKAKRGKKKQVENVSGGDDDDEVLVIGETHKDVKRKRHNFRGQNSVLPVLGETRDSTKVDKSNKRNNNANANGKDCGETLLWTFADKVEPLQRSKSEEELNKLWEEAEISRSKIN